MELLGYTITKTIHEYNSTKLYQGIHNETHNPVIIKILELVYWESMNITQLLRILNLIKNSQSKEFLHIYHLVSNKEQLIFVQEDFQSITLSEYLDKTKTVPVNDCLNIAQQITKALILLHTNGITHNALYPHNILINTEDLKIKIIGFDIEGTLFEVESNGKHTDKLMTNLSYSSPESTNRINRNIDYRTDYYSLGAIMYHMLCGEPPFQSEDPLQLIHNIVAKPVSFPAGVKDRIPRPIIKLIQKLLVKDAEDRYQSAHGLLYDLERCLDHWDKEKTIKPFKLASRDFSYDFHLPSKLYARAQEKKEIQTIINHLEEGQKQLLLVSGEPGIGKTQMVMEMIKGFSIMKGNVITGKFDQYSRNIPYTVFAQAYSKLVHQLIGEPEESIAVWKEKIISTLGGNAGLMVSMIPELQYIIGSPSQIKELSPEEIKNYLNISFANFTRLFSDPYNPLIIFFDDLQWIDIASLELIKNLLISPQLKHFLIIGAYRDNEVPNNHPLFKFIQRIEQENIPVKSINLKKLDKESTFQLIADTINTKPSIIEFLTEYIYDKSKGNPFFIKQRLISLYEQNLISVSADTGWNINIDSLKQLELNHSLLDILYQRLIQLSDKTLSYIKIASCIGNEYKASTLAMVIGNTVADIHNTLQEAVESGIINYKDNHYSFIHDKLQETAYKMMEANQRELFHYKIGQTFLELSEREKQDNLFFIVDQLNKGWDHFADDNEKIMVMELNLKAAEKALYEASFDFAHHYAEKALVLLGPNPWKTFYPQTYSLYSYMAISLNYINRCKEALAKCDHLISQAKDIYDQIKAYQLKMQIHFNNSQYQEVIETGIEALSVMGIKLNMKVNKLTLIRKLIGYRIRFRQSTLKKMVSLPYIKDQKIIHTMKIIYGLYQSAYLFNRFDLFILVCIMNAELTRKYGNAKESSIGFIAFTIPLIKIFRSYQYAYNTGYLGLKLSEYYKDTIEYGDSLHTYSLFISFLKENLNKSLDYHQQAHKLLMEKGSFNNVANNLMVYLTNMDLIGRSVQELLDFFNKYVDFIYMMKNKTLYDSFYIYNQFYLAVKGKTNHRTSFTDEHYNENLGKRKLFSYKHTNSYLVYYLIKLKLLLIFKEYDEIFYLFNEIDFNIISNVIINYQMHHNFYLSIGLIRYSAQLNKTERKTALKRIHKTLKQLKKIRKSAPDNYDHLYYYLKAELYRHKHQYGEMVRLLEQGIQNCEKNQFLFFEALGNELLFDACLENQQLEKARFQLKKTIDLYERWGGTAKVEQLKEDHRDLVDLEQLYSDKGKLKTTYGHKLIKLLHSAHYERNIKALLKEMLQITLSLTKTQRAVFLMEKDEILCVLTEKTVDQILFKILDYIPLENYKNLPLSIIKQVYYSQNLFLLSKQEDKDHFENDPYLDENAVDKIICFPLLIRDNFIGLIYCESYHGNFDNTDFPINTLNYLISQMVISLDNALTYGYLDKSTKLLKETSHLLQSDILQHSNIIIEEYIKLKEEKERVINLINSLEKTFEDNKAILNKQNIGIFLTDQEGTIQFINTKALQILNQEYDICYGKKWHQLSLFNHSQKESINAMLDEPEGNRDKVLIKCPDAAKQPFEIEIVDNPGDTNQKIFFIEKKDMPQQKNQHEASQDGFIGMIGESQEIQNIFQQIKNIGPLNCTLLIEGETGTGKELVARAIHQLSPRNQKPFVAVNCAGLTESLLSSQLFGHKKGAFTGAKENQKGFFEAAEGGTIFLDEIGDISLNLQTHLLRILEQGEYYRLGESQLRKVDVRIIAATNKDLAREVEKGNFRKDLLYRLKIARIHLPPLRERKGDISQLADYFLKQSNHQTGKSISHFSENALQRLLDYTWPGNVRELKNIVYYAVIHSHSNDIKITDFPTEIQQYPPLNHLHDPSLSKPELSEKQRIIDALELNQGNKTKAAKQLRMSRVTFYKKLKKYKLD